MPNAKQKNNKIELLRFIFCVYVIGFHLNKYLIGEPDLSKGVHLDIFPHGAMSVEFFFFLSGSLMAMSVYKHNMSNPQDKNHFCAQDGLLFLRKKYMGIFPYHLVAFVISFVGMICFEQVKSVFKIAVRAMESIPAFFLVQMAGFNYSTPEQSPNHVEWYISCMLISMAIIYPALKKNYDLYAKYIGPIVALLILGYFQQTTGRITGVAVWMGLCFKSMLRAFADISLGVTAFEVSRELQSKADNGGLKCKLVIAETICFIATTGFVMMTFGAKYEIISMIPMWILLVISLSGKGICIKNQVANNICAFLGKLSLPLYLSQVAALYFTIAFLSEKSIIIQIISTIVLTLVISIIVMLIGDYLEKCWKRK